MLKVMISIVVFCLGIGLQAETNKTQPTESIDVQGIVEILNSQENQQRDKKKEEIRNDISALIGIITMFPFGENKGDFNYDLAHNDKIYVATMYSVYGGDVAFIQRLLKKNKKEESKLHKILYQRINSMLKAYPISLKDNNTEVTYLIRILADAYTTIPKSVVEIIKQNVPNIPKNRQDPLNAILYITGQKEKPKKINDKTQKIMNMFLVYAGMKKNETRKKNEGKNKDSKDKLYDMF